MMPFSLRQYRCAALLDVFQTGRSMAKSPDRVTGMPSIMRCRGSRGCGRTAGCSLGSNPEPVAALGLNPFPSARSMRASRRTTPGPHIVRWHTWRVRTFNRHFGSSPFLSRLLASGLVSARERLGILQGINAAAWRPSHIRRILGSSLTTGVIIDVGANKGTFVSTCRLAGFTGTIFAFEPQTELAADILRVGGPRTVVRTECLGNQGGSTSIFRSHVGDPKASTLGTSPGIECESMVVPQRTLDSFVSTEGIEKVDFLKVDAEGADYHVLEGAAEVLASGIVIAVACEISWRSHSIGVFPGDVQDLLSRSGFNHFFVTSPHLGLLPVSRRIPNYEGGTANLVALRG